MNRPLTLITIVAAAALAGCDSSPETITGGTKDPQANEIANAVANVQLPPSIVASHKYRCGDNSILSIDWLSDGTSNSARVTPEGGNGTSLTQAEADGEYTAEGATLKGDPKATSATFNGKTCKK